MMARKKKSRKKDCGCKHMAETHCVFMKTIEALALVTAATHAVRSGIDEGEAFDDILEASVNGLLEQCNIDCEFEDGVMTLVVNPIGAD
jgi:hypothetical protein